MPDAASPRVRERVTLGVLDHSGPSPRAVAIVEVTAEDGRVVTRSERRPTEAEAAALVAARVGAGRLGAAVAFLREDWRRTLERVRGVLGLGRD